MGYITCLLNIACIVRLVMYQVGSMITNHTNDNQINERQGYGEHKWRSQNTANARAQRGHTTFVSCLVPRPRPPLCCLQYGMQKQLGGLGDDPPQNFGIFELHRSILRLL